MVYLAKVINEIRQELLSDETIQKFCYFYVVDRQQLNTININLVGQEENLAAHGYKSLVLDKDEILTIIKRKPIRGIDYTANIFKLLGIYLASGKLVQDKVNEKFENSSIRYKYLISKVLPEFEEKFRNILNQDAEADSPYLELLRFIYGIGESADVEIFIAELLKKDLDFIDLILLEDIQHIFITNSITKINYINLNAKAIVRQVLLNFRNAVKKITRDRRKDHQVFQIHDEYDVQDLLYVMLKPLFPKLTIEEPTPKVGAKYNKIDLIIREEGLMIEVKMIKVSDDDEKPFVEQLKNDIQSYYRYPFLKDLLVYVYDPQSKTKDVQNFYELNGIQEIQGIRFNVEVIVGN